MFQSSIFPVQCYNPNNVMPNIYGSDIFIELQRLKEKEKFLEEENDQLKAIIENYENSRQNKDGSYLKRKEKTNFNKKFACPYPGCFRKYSSNLAMNLHMRNKHNAGTKTFREAVAKHLILAQEKGDQIPKTDITFPPGYLKDFKKRFFNES